MWGKSRNGGLIDGLEHGNGFRDGGAIEEMDNWEGQVVTRIIDGLGHMNDFRNNALIDEMVNREVKCVQV